MKSSITNSTSIKSSHKTTKINLITKYFLTNKPTSTQHCSKTTKFIKKIKNATKNTIRKLKSVSQT